ncbi:MAG: MFS transporter [Candidatus Bathyarchaeia archaeon]|nr:MFS transporter [Candidatus Bathyarchaeota archaeon]
MTGSRFERSGERVLKALYRRVLLSSFGSGFVSPFISIYAAQLGATPTELGFVQAVNSVSPSIAQIPWGFVVDRVKRCTLFIALGTLLYGFILLLLIFASDMLSFILVVLSAYVLLAMAAPASNYLLGEYSSGSDRGRVMARLNAMASIGSMPATILSGYIIYRVGGSVGEMYRIPLILCFVFNLAAALAIFKVGEEPIRGFYSFSIRDWVKALKSNRYFKRLCILSTFQGFSMGLSWPLFTLTIVRVVRADMFQVSLLSVVSASTAIIVRRFTGRLADRAGRKPLIVLGRVGLFLIPLIYAIARSIYELIVVNFVIGILTAASDVALSAYLLDISPRGMRGSYTSLYNAIAGSSSFIGSTVGGYLLDQLTGLGYGFHEAMTIMYTVSIIGRLASGILYLTIEEPYKYPARFEEELKRIFEEELEAVEKRIVEYRRIEDEDLEWFEKLSGSKP